MKEIVWYDGVGKEGFSEEVMCELRTGAKWRESIPDRGISK